MLSTKITKRLLASAACLLSLYSNPLPADAAQPNPNLYRKWVWTNGVCTIKDRQDDSLISQVKSSTAMMNQDEGAAFIDLGQGDDVMYIDFEPEGYPIPHPEMGSVRYETASGDDFFVFDNGLAIGVQNKRFQMVCVY